MDREQIERVRRAMEPPWDDVREQRVLGRILEVRRAEAIASPRRRVRTGPAVLVSAVIAAAAAVLFFVFRPAPSTRIDVAKVAPPAAPSAEAAAHLTFVDGSVATLEPDARVRVDTQSPGRVELSQLGGRVGYEVVHDTSRPFLVHAGKVVVSVLGTKFVVVRSKNQVEVRVTEGLVGVDDGARVREVSPGETLIVPVEGDGDETSAAPNPIEKPGSATPSNAGGTGSVAPPVTAASLLAKADEARAKGRTDEAASALQQMLILFPADPRIPSAAFTLGRLERKRGHAAAAAQAFARCLSAAPAGALAEDALAEEALAWAAAGQKKAAADAASRYLSAHPAGAYTARLRPLVEGAP